MPRASRPCSRAGCPEVATHRGLCPAHTQQYEQARGTTAQRGYGSRYQRSRTHALAQATHCPRCGQPFTSANPATGGHVRSIRKGGSTSDGIEAQCRKCNYGWRRTGL